MTLFNSVKPTSISTNPVALSQPNVIVDCEDRWQVYHRLQELDIPCQCSSHQPLKVNIRTATEALQLWSIVGSISHPRKVLAARLTRSWQRPCK